MRTFITTTTAFTIMTASAVIADEIKVSLADICPESGCTVELDVELDETIGKGFFLLNEWSRGVVGFEADSHPTMMYSIKGVPDAYFRSPEAAARYVTWLYEMGEIDIDIIDGDESAPGS